MKKFLSMLLSATMAISLLTACGGNNSTEDDTSADDTSGTSSDELQIVLISNQRSGDLGPVDAMFAGAKRAEEDFGVTVQTMEVTDAASYEEEIRAMAKAGYDLILTTFSPMTEATKAVATDYPDVKFAAIFQNINVDGETYENVWDTEYRGEECTFITGAMAATLSETGIIGYISGDEASGV